MTRALKKKTGVSHVKDVIDVDGKRSRHFEGNASPRRKIRACQDRLPTRDVDGPIWAKQPLREWVQWCKPIAVRHKVDPACRTLDFNNTHELVGGNLIESGESLFDMT